jgi:mycoredoxin-dependent peroxiredoxin
MTPIRVGSVAPDFVLTDQHGHLITLSGYRGKYQVLLMFLPAAFTPVCSTEVPAVAALMQDFLAADTIPLIVDVDNSPANLAWGHDCGADSVPILSDFWPHGAVSKSYGALADDGMGDRTSVLIDKSGKVVYAVGVGRYGKRSIPGLLAIARAVNAGKAITAPAAAASVMARVDLPILYTQKRCMHCARVKSYLDRSGLSRKVIQKEVTTDLGAMKEALAIDPSGEFPLLVMPDGSHVIGDANIISSLSSTYGVAA